MDFVPNPNNPNQANVPFNAHSMYQLPPGGFVRLGRALAAGWRAALADQAPGRSFDVAFTTGDDDYGPTVSIMPLD